MPRTLSNAGPDADQPKSKRQKLTNSQLERKRELDREAQRTIRERTKNHIAHLEALVQQLQGDQGGQVERLVARLNESRAEVNRLRDALTNITKISSAVTGTNQTISDASHETQVKQETSPDPPADHIFPGKRDKSYSISNTDYDPDSDHQRVPEDLSEQEVHPNVAHPSHAYGGIPADTYQYPDYIYTNYDTKPQPDVQVVVEQSCPPSEDVPATNPPASQLSVSQMASSIMANEKLEGRYWYLAGVLLTEILKKQQQDAFVNFANDEDIAIRAVFEGWSSVAERYPLDRGWQWLKELDETIYFHHFGPAERLMNLRNCRYQFLHQCYPDAGWSKNLPNFYPSRRPSPQDMAVDPLGEHFPWPGFRKQLLFSPRKFATNKFMEALRRNLRFIWTHSSDDLFDRDPFSGSYGYSDLFLKHIRDIRCYAVRPGFFQNFPELGQDIPWNSVEEPSPLTMISHRRSIDTNSTTSTSRHSPGANDEHEEDRGRQLQLAHCYSDLPRSWHPPPSPRRCYSNGHHIVVPGFVKELTDE